MRLMVDLARHWGQGTVSLHAVAEREDLPLAYLEQLVASLRRAGLVNGKRGAGGGYLLARDPAKITAGDIVRALEGPIEPQICTAEGDPVLNCVREQSCGTRTVWLRLQSSIAAALDGMNLAELARSAPREAALSGVSGG
ncbi:MAG: Rrf2 family transcriptional regulator [Chloroflexi bacterium]|nr:MAG: Rrf2 family transcriptional regulator [Chloroflexota bacterium]